MSADETYIQLGRAGDVINLLPLMHERGFPGVVVAKEFAPILDGQNYCRPIIFEGGWKELDRAKHENPKAICAQVHGMGYDAPQTVESFQREAWKRCGYDKRWEQRELVFNQRNFAREAELAARFDWSKPVILYSVDGLSCPFPHKVWLRTVIETAFGETHSIVDLMDKRAFGARIYDILGLYDRAEMLVSIDTMHLHLSQASSVPVCAYVNSSPWVRSMRRASFRLYERYAAIGADPLGAAKRLIECIGKPHYSGKIAHTWASYPMHGEDARRAKIAQHSWKEVGWDHIPVMYRSDASVANSASIDGDKKSVPQFKSMVRAAWLRTTADVLVFTNSDVGFAPGIDARMRHLLARAPAIYGYRWDAAHHIEEPQTYEQAVSLRWYGGLDLFAFTRDWWKRNGAKIPDFFIGRTNWDLVMRDIVKSTGGAPLYGYVWHELHDSDWLKQPMLPSNQHNVAISKRWFETHDSTRPFPS